MTELPHGLSRGDEDRQEIRLALVMTGGVSLAVWMGGVAGEIYRATHFDDVYGELLDLTAATARVDVLAGTSAGGLNGALLAAAIAGRASPDDFFEIRDLWFSKASMLEMMRSPFKRDPPSLLQGDEYFLPELEATFARLLRGADGGEQRPPNIYLHITGTLRKGRLRGFADDFGEVISEVDHRGTFTFRRDDERNDFTRDDGAAALALAARSSASFPIAFEASFVPVRGERDEPPEMRPNLIEIANFDKDRFVIDGGVLLNKPIDPALRAVFAQPTERHVRRVLAYVVPDPGDPVEPEPDKAEALPVMTELAWDSLVRLPRVQLVADDLNELRDRNARVQQRIQLRELLLTGERSEAFVELAEGYFDLYRNKAAERSVAEMLARVAQSVGRRRPLLEGEHDWDRPALRRALVEARAAWLPRTFPEVGSVGGASGRPWDWGIASLESACLAAVDLFRRAAYLMPFAAGDEDPGLEGLLADREHLLGRNADLRRWRGELQIVLDKLRLINDLGERYWDWKLSQAKRVADDPERLGAWAYEAYANWLHQPGVHEESRQQPLTRMQKALTNLRGLDPSWPERIVELNQTEVLMRLRGLGDELAGIVIDAAPLLREIATLSRRIEARRYGIREDSGVAERSPQQVLLRMIRSLLPSEGSDSGEQRTECLRRLLALHVADLLLGDRAELEQPVAFIRISGEAPNDFDPGRKTAAKKLAGIQLGHFGAFFKRSWRANDWMWGRLDGAVRLSLVLLNPARLRQLGHTAEDVYEQLHRISRARQRDGAPLLDRHGKRLLDDDDERFLEELWAQDRQRIQDELTFLARAPDPAAPDPESLPACARAVARTIQATILQQELPVVGEAVSASQEEGGAVDTPARDFLRGLERARGDPSNPLPAREASRLLAQCQIGNERISGEIGHDALTATATGAAATAVAAAGGTRSGLGPLRAFAAVLRTATLAIYVLVQGALRGSKTGFALKTVALALAGSLVAMRVLGVEEIPNGVTALAVVVLVAWAFWTALRTHAWGLLAVAAAAALVVAALYSENVVNAVVRSERSGAVQWADEHPGTLAGAAALAVMLALWVLFRGVMPKWHRRVGRGFALVAVVPLAIGLTSPIDDFLEWLQSDERDLVGWRDRLVAVSAWLEDHQALVVVCALVLGAVVLNVLSRGLRAWVRSI